jgi:hypothetical protein
MARTAEEEEMETRKAIAELEAVLAKYERLGLAEHLAFIREEIDRVWRKYPNLAQH